MCHVRLISYFYILYVIYFIHFPHVRIHSPVQSGILSWMVQCRMCRTHQLFRRMPMVKLSTDRSGTFQSCRFFISGQPRITTWIRRRVQRPRPPPEVRALQIFIVSINLGRWRSPRIPTEYFRTFSISPELEEQIKCPGWFSDKIRQLKTTRNCSIILQRSRSLFD